MKIITQRIGMRHTSCNFLSMHMALPSSSFNHHTFIVVFDFGVTSSITTNISPHTILFYPPAPESKVLIFIPKKKCELITCVLTPTKFHRRNQTKSTTKNMAFQSPMPSQEFLWDVFRR